MKIAVTEGVKHRRESFGGIIQSPKGLVCLNKEDYDRFLEFKNSPKEVDHDDFTENLIEEGILQPLS